MNKKLAPFKLSLAILLFIASALIVSAQTSVFTYQGRFTDTTTAQPTNGTYSMTFRLYDALSGGNQIGAPITASVTVVGGVFSAQLDFGAAAFNTTGARYLEIQVGASVLTPRQQITSSPFSMRSINAGAADSLSANCVTCVTDAQINSVSGSKVTGTVSSATTAQSAATATTATTAGNVTGVVAVANGGTGSSTQNFVDLTTAQTVAGNKTLTGLTNLSGGARLQNSATDPEAASSANAGRVYFNTAIGNLRLSDGTRWITAGQPVIYQVFDTAGRSAVATTTLTVQPGVTQTFTVPTGFTASVTINATVGGTTVSTTAGQYATVDAAVFLDGGLLARGGYNRFTIGNVAATNAVGSTTLATGVTNLAAGSHTIDLRTARAGGTSTVNIGGPAATIINAGEMVLTVYYAPISTNLLEDVPANNKSDQPSNNKRIAAPSSKN